MRSKHGNVRKETNLGVTKAESIGDIDKGDMQNGLHPLNVAEVSG